MKHTIQEIRKEYDRLDNLCGVDTSGLEIVISPKAVKRHGCCTCKRGKPVKISISQFVLDTEEDFWDTIRHEYAHALVKIRNPKGNNGHDSVWKKACLEVGCSPSRLAAYSSDDAKRIEDHAKYRVTCQKCGKAFYYLRINKIVKYIKNGSKDCHCPCCYGHDFVVKTLGGNNLE